MKKILYVLHSGITGGTFLTNRDLMKNVQEYYDVFLLSAENDSFRLYSFFNNDLTLIKVYPRHIKTNISSDQKNIWKATDFHNSWFSYIYSDILISFNIDIVHIRHLINHSFDLPFLAKKLGIPVILSIHDFYFICPYYVLLDENYNFCWGSCNDNGEKCYCPLNSLNNINSKEVISLWRENILKLFTSIDFFVTTSDFVKNLFLSIYLDRTILNDDNFKIIEHGRDFPNLSEDYYEIPSADKPIKILCPANHLNAMKGSELIKLIKKEDKNDKLEFHFFGNCHDNLEEFGICHGTFERDEFHKKVHEISPSFIGIFSIWPETFCHTLTEAWSCGIPVIGTNIGVIKDRILKNGGGWIIDRNNPKKCYLDILNISENIDEYLDVVENIKNIHFDSTFDMALKYMALYNLLTEKKEVYNYNLVDASDFRKNLEIIDDSSLFDKDFYLEKYSDVKKSGMDPLIHWVKYGYKEDFRSPNPFFSNYFYKKFYLGEYSKWNPLTHYILFGEELNYKRNLFDKLSHDFSITQIKSIFSALKNVTKIFLIVNIFSEETLNNINLIFKNTFGLFEIVLILNEELNEKYSKIIHESFSDDVAILVNNNLNFFDFIKNIILEHKNQDMIILNECTKVSYNWLTKLKIKAYSDKKIGFASPISNFFIDVIPFEEYYSNFKFSVNGINFLFNKSSSNLKRDVPFITSFCLFIKRNVLDEDVFYNNYHEFNQDLGIFFMILSNNHWISVIDDSTYVYLDQLNNSDFKYLEKNSYLRNFFNNYFMGDNVNKLKLIADMTLKSANYKTLSNRILFLIDMSQFNKNILFDFISNNYECYFLIASKNHLILRDKHNCLKLFEISHYEDYKRIYFEILFSFKIDMIQINNFKYNSLDIIDVSNLLNIPIITNIEDSEGILKHFGEDSSIILSSDEIIFTNSQLYEEYSEMFPDMQNLSLINTLELQNLNNSLINNNSPQIKLLFIFKYEENILNFLNEINNHEMKCFDCYFLGDIEYDLFNKNNYLGKFDEKKFNTMMNSFKFDFVICINEFDGIFHILNEIYNFKIPVLFSKNIIISEFIDNIGGTYKIDFKSSDYVLNKIFDLYNDLKYLDLIKEIYLSDQTFKDYILRIYNFLLNLYAKYEKYDKLALTNSLDSSNNVKEFKLNFKNFLIKSYTSPIFDYNSFDESSLNYFEDIANYLSDKGLSSEEKPLVSVILPIFNRCDIFMNAVNSVLKQNYSNFELIIVDDGSDDGSNEILEKLCDERIKILTHDSNEGVASARNTALRCAKGDIISYLDSDNLWDERYIACVVGSFLELPNADAVYFGQLIYGDVTSIKSVRFGAFNKSLLKNSNYIDLNCFSHKKGVYDEIGGFDDNLDRLVDWDLILRINNYFNIYSIPVLISKYYVNRDDRITSNARNNIAIRNSNLIYMKNILKKTENKSNLEKSIRGISILIANFSSLKNIQKSINSILSSNFDNGVEIFVFDDTQNLEVNYYLKYLEEKNLIQLFQSDNFTYEKIIKIAVSSSNFDEIIFVNNINEFSNNAICNMQYALNFLKNSGVIIPQIISLSSKYKDRVPYANKSLPCDISISYYYDNIVNIPIFNNGEVIELKNVLINCICVKRDSLKKFLSDCNYPIADENFSKFFSDYIRNSLNLTIYHISNSEIYL